MKRTILLTPNIMSSLSISHKGKSLGVEAHSPKSFFIKLYNHPLFLSENEVLVESDRIENDLLLQEIIKKISSNNSFKEPLTFKGIRSLLLRSIEELELSGLTELSIDNLKFPDSQRTTDLKEILKVYFSKRQKGFTYPQLLSALLERISSGKLDQILKDQDLAIPPNAIFGLSGLEEHCLTKIKEKSLVTNDYFAHLLKEKTDYSNVSVSGVIKDKTSFLNLFFWMKENHITADHLTIGTFEYDRFAPILYNLSRELEIPVYLKRGLLVTNFSFFENLMSKFQGDVSHFKDTFSITGKEDSLEMIFKKKALGIYKELSSYLEKTISFGNPLLLETELINALSTIRFSPEELEMSSAGFSLYPVEELDYLKFENLALLGLEDHNYPPKEKRHPLLDEETKAFLNKNSGLALPLNTQSVKTDLVERLVLGTQGKIYLTFEAYSLETGKKIIPSPFFNKILKANNKELTIENIFELGKVSTGLLEEINIKNPYQNLTHAGIVSLKNADYTEKLFDPKSNEFDFIETSEKLEFISASALEAWFSCPYKFALRNLKKLYPPKIIEVDKSFWLSPMEKGTQLHEAYERILTPFVNGKGKSISQYRTFLKGLGEKPNEILSEILKELSDHRPEVPNWIKKGQIEEMFENVRVFVQNETEWASNNSFYPISLEKEFKDFAIPFYPSGPTLTGAIDRIDTDGEGQYIIWDYKTGNNSLVKNDKTLLLKEKGKTKKTIAFHLQHGFYSYVLNHILGENEKVKGLFAGYYFVDQDERIVSNSTDYTPHFENLKNLYISECSKNVFYKNANSCSYCDYSPFCLKVPAVRSTVLPCLLEQIEKIEELKMVLIESKKTSNSND